MGKRLRAPISEKRRYSSLHLKAAPGMCGKTLAAAVLAGEMGLPLMSVRLDALFSRFLGATAVQLRAIFEEMPRRPGVYLFDEFDSVAKARGDSQDVGEMTRVVTAGVSRTRLAPAMTPSAPWLSMVAKNLSRRTS